MRKAFVVGHPIAHSRSPLIHGHWLAEHGIDGTYERRDVAPEAFPDFLRTLRAQGFAGGNVTIPHKEAAFRLVDDLTPRAQAIGAVNTLFFDGDGRLCGDNTDAPGFVAHLDQSLDPGWPERAIAVGLIARGLRRILIANRTRARAETLAALDPSHIEAVDWEALPDALGRTGLLVNTTSLGMIGHPPLAIDLEPLPRDAAVADIVYAPLETPLLAAARARSRRRRRSRDAAAPGGAGFRPVVRDPAERDAGSAREDRRRSRDPMTGTARKRPFVLGLTGSIGMGKSATAAMFREHGVPVHDADAAVHALYGPGGAAAAAIGRAFPGTLGSDGSVDRARLRSAVLGHPERLAALEAIVHPLAQAAARSFLSAHADEPLVLLDIPLLYETGADARCDAVLVVTAPPEVQRARVLARPGMDEAAFAAILAKQMPDAEKRARATYRIDTGLGLAHARAAVADLVARLRP